MANIYFLFVFTTNWFQNRRAKQKKIPAQPSPHLPLFPSSNSILTSSATSYSYSTTAPLTTTPTLHPVLPRCNQFFSYPNYSLPPTTNTTNPGSRIILTSSTGKENVSLSMTYTTTKPFFQSTYYSQRSSTTGYCGYNSYVYPPHQQQLYQTAPTNITLSSSISYSYSSPITTTRALPLTTTPTLHT